jgi:hypothetical protein
MEVITVFRLLGRFAESLVGLQEPASAHPLRLTKEWRVEQTSHHGRTRCDFRWDLPKLPISSDLKSICRCSIYRYIDRIDVSALRLVLTLVWPCTVCSGSPSFRLALFAFIFLELKMLKIERHIFIICILVAIAWKSRYWLVYSQASCLPFWRIVIGRSRLSG